MPELISICSIPPDHGELVVGVGGRDRVVVAVEAHQRQRVRPSLLDPPRLERVLRQRQHRRLVVDEQLRLGLPLTTQTPLKISQAPLPQMRVQLVNDANDGTGTRKLRRP